MAIEPSARRALQACCTGIGVLAACVVWTAGCSSTAAPGVIVVGSSLPLSGPAARDGEAMRRGYARAIGESNSAGGVLVSVLGRRIPLRLDVRDDRGEASRVEEAIDRLAGEGSLAFLVTAGPVRAAVEAVRAERLGRPLVVNPKEAPGLPGAHARWTVSVPASGDLETRAYLTARALVEALGRATAIDPASVRAALDAAVVARAAGLTPRGSLR